MKGADSAIGYRYTRAELAIGVLLLGSIWGLLEATLGGVLHLIDLPNTGAVMAGIGSAIMGIAFVIYRKPSLVPLIGAVAASFKLLDVWLIPFVPPMKIVSPAWAIVSESLAMGLVMLVAHRRMDSIAVRIVAGALGGFASAALWVLPHSTLASALQYSATVQTPVPFLVNQGLLIAGFSAVLLTVGFAVGQRLRTAPMPPLARPSIRYSLGAGAVLLCWALSAVTITAGL